MTILLLTGIFRRIHEYGVTENRFIVATLACWLVGITIYFLTKKNDIGWIPITLSALCLVVCIGPWNISTVAKESQLKRFREITSSKKLVDAEGKISGNHVISKEQKEELLSIIQFFRMRDESGLEGYFPRTKNNAARQNRIRHYDVMEEYLNQHVKFDESKTEETYYSFSSKLSSTAEQTFAIDDFKTMTIIKFSPFEPKQQEDKGWRLDSQENSQMLDVYKNNVKITTIDAKKKMLELTALYGKSNSQVPSKDLTFDFKDGKSNVLLTLTSLSKSGQSVYCEGFLFY